MNIATILSYVRSLFLLRSRLCNVIKMAITCSKVFCKDRVELFTEIDEPVLVTGYDEWVYAMEIDEVRRLAIEGAFDDEIQEVCMLVQSLLSSIVK